MCSAMRSYASVISEVDDSSLLSRLLLTAVTPFEEVDGLNASLVRLAGVLLRLGHEQFSRELVR